MAGQADAETALVQLATAALYPDGSGDAAANGAPSRIYRGWPNPAALDADLLAGVVTVSVFPVAGATRVTTRYAAEWDVAPRAATMSVTVQGETAHFEGTAGAGQLAGLLIEGHPYVYRTRTGDTTALVAAVLANTVNADRPALAAGSTVTVPGASRLVARVAADATATLERRRQEQRFRVTVWAPTPGLRDASADVLDAAFAATPFLGLPDGSAARLAYVATTSFDQHEDAGLYRRDLVYSVEFPTTQTTTQPAMLFGVLGLDASVNTV